MRAPPHIPDHWSREFLRFSWNRSPADVAGMSIWDAGQPVIVVTLPLHGLFAVDGSSIAPPSVDVAAGVAWIVQDTYCHRCVQWPKDRRLAVAQTRGKQKTLLTKGFDGLAGGAHARERVEEMGDRLRDLQSQDRASRCRIGRSSGRLEGCNDTRRSHLVKDPAA